MSIWNDERIEQLKALWAEGLSTQTIANTMGNGITKNAVIGKLHRLKLNVTVERPARPKAERAPRKSSAPRTISRAARSNVRSAARALDKAFNEAEMIEPKAEALPFVLPETTHFGSARSVLGLTESTCKWPIGDPRSSDFRFCGCASEDKQAYCTFHLSRAYQPATTRRQAAA